jgi:hypothetical protein
VVRLALQPRMKLDQLLNGDSDCELQNRDLLGPLGQKRKSDVVKLLLLDQSVKVKLTRGIGSV